ncbi:Ferric uptake regulator family protein [Paenibacillaceae bacterium GAS479]|nr:Ferric uptake regulator family protein [Paenibacillaceae bacterium GAS479]
MAISPSRRNVVPSSASPAARYRSPSASRGLLAALGKLEHQGIHLNPQRYMLLEYLYTADEHPTVEELVSQLNASGRVRAVGATAVYSQLRVFERLGLVQEWNDVSSAPRYGPAVSQGSKAVG